jgi:acyloxyacyl hydrolase
MIKATIVILLMTALVVTGKQFEEPVPAGGGAACTACVIGMRVLQQVAIREGSIGRAIEVICQYFPQNFNLACKLFFAAFAGIIVREFDRGASPDRVCQVMRMCTNPECALFRPKDSKMTDMYQPLPALPKEILAIYNKLGGEEWWRAALRMIGLGRLIEVFETHMPFSDGDSDRFATSFGLRGTAWRGRDCADMDKTTYPGRKSPGENTRADYNCNGISGMAPSGKTYKDELCDVEQRGIIMVGDSACAHFRIPEQYINVTNISIDTYKHLYDLLEREADWPQLSWATGHRQDHTGDTPGNVDSIYMRLKNHNRCNHRDFQNVCVNGARSGAIASKLIKTIQRNQTHDHPAIVFIAPIGNDICTPNPNGRGTNPVDFHNNIVRSLDYLETQLPKGSFVVFIGLVDGRVLWNYLHNLTHPIGAKYSDVYHHLSCLQLNPCWLWMNSNETWRNHGSQRAEELNQQYVKIIAERADQYKHFKMQYQSFPFQEMFDEARRLGRPPHSLIEPFDGFHPSQFGQNLQGKIIWDRLIKEHPEAIGPSNRHNEEIKRIFGEQGGY